MKSEIKVHHLPRIGQLLVTTDTADNCYSSTADTAGYRTWELCTLGTHLKRVVWVEGGQVREAGLAQMVVQVGAAGL